MKEEVVYQEWPTLRWNRSKTVCQDGLLIVWSPAVLAFPPRIRSISVTAQLSLVSTMAFYQFMMLRHLSNLPVQPRSVYLSMCEVRHMLELPGVCLLRCNARFAAWLQKSSCSKIMWRNMWDIWIHWSKTRLVAVLSTYQWYPIRESATELEQYGQLVVINVC